MHREEFHTHFQIPRTNIQSHLGKPCHNTEFQLFILLIVIQICKRKVKKKKKTNKKSSNSLVVTTQLSNSTEDILKNIISAMTILILHKG